MSQSSQFYKLVCFSGHVVLIISVVIVFYWRKNYSQNQSCNLKSHFVVIIDAGSSGSRIHIYEWSIKQKDEGDYEEGEGDSNTPNEELVVNLPEPSKKNDQALSQYTKNPKNAGKTLHGLIRFAKQAVPSCQWSSTPVYLMATAGLRLLPNTVQDEILQSCKLFLQRTGLKTENEWVRIIDGKEEATFAYLAVNYLFGQVVNDKLGGVGECHRFVGVFELGGASFQAAFQASEDVGEQQSIDASLLGVGLHIYANSFLSLGLDEAFIEVHKWLGESMAQQSNAISPCVPKGGEIHSAMKGTGNFKGCRKLVNVFYRRHEPCIEEQNNDADGNCNLNGQTVPDATMVSKGAVFVATENFFYTIKNLNLPMDASLAEVEKAGRDFCRLSWQQLQRRYRDVPERYLLKTCFGAVLVLQLLHDSFGIPMDDRGRVLFVNKVNDVSLDWTLGVLVQQLNRSNPTYNT